MFVRVGIADELFLARVPVELASHGVGDISQNGGGARAVTDFDIGIRRGQAADGVDEIAGMRCALVQAAAAYGIHVVGQDALICRAFAYLTRE